MTAFFVGRKELRDDDWDCVEWNGVSRSLFSWFMIPADLPVVMVIPYDSFMERAKETNLTLLNYFVTYTWGLKSCQKMIKFEL